MSEATGLSTREEFLQSSFDFVIVGGGTAGCVLAARLTENPDVSVGVIEAGAPRLGDPTVESLAGMSAMLHRPEYDWSFTSTPQSGNAGRAHHVARGKMLGGSSGINFMLYSRPTAADIDGWSEGLGLDGWSSEGLRPYFCKSQTREAQSLDREDPAVRPIDGAFHGTEGPIHTTINPSRVPVEDKLFAALDEECGSPEPADPWAGTHRGFYRSLFAADRTGPPKRSYAGNAYLAPALHRPNLKVLTEAVATRILVDERGKTATGVEFRHGGVTSRVAAGMEVIVSCSAIKGPHLLELSGIGDPAVLRAAGLDCVVPLPGVGENLQEQPFSTLVYEMADGVVTVDSLFKDPAFFQEQQKLLQEEQSGLLAGALGLMGYIPYAQTAPEPDLDRTLRGIKSSPLAGDAAFQAKQAELIASRLGSPESPAMQVVGFPAAVDAAHAYADFSRLSRSPSSDRNACYSLAACLNYPLSRGSVHAASADPLADPRVDLGFLTHPADVDVLAAGIAFLDRAMRSEGVSGSVKRRVDPPPEVDLQDLEQGREFVRAGVMSYCHVLGTCAMGQVVDERLRVKGVGGLRVADVSVVPMQVSGGVLSTVYALAERAADMIKADHSL